MTANSSFAYPAEYYYPEFIDSRLDDPRQSPTRPVPVAASIDNGKGLTVTATTTDPSNKPISIQKKSTNRQKPPTNIALDIVTDQGLPDTDITKALTADPKKNLLRDPAERNIPRLIVDNSIIKQAVRTTKIVTTNLDDNTGGTVGNHQGSNRRLSVVNGYANGDLTHKIKHFDPPRQQPSLQHVTFMENEQAPIDDYWKQEVHVNDDGLVTIEPLTYDRNTYDGPFGLSRQATVFYYLAFGLIAILAAIFLIMTGVFYGQNYPSQSSNTGTLVGICVCALAFYLALQLFLIGLWHQTYRRENPKRVVGRAGKHNDSSAHLKTSMEENEAYDYQQPVNYTGYGDYSTGDYTAYSNGGYVSNANEQMLLQQPGAATGAAYYDPVTWPSNVEVETQPDPKFFQPMEYSYGQQSAVESPSTVVAFTGPTTETSNNAAASVKSEKKRHRRHHHNKRSVQAEPPKPTFDSIVPTSSTVIEKPLPVLTKAPETNELLRSIAESEKTNRSKQADRDVETSSLNENRRRHSHRRRRHRRRSCSSCSTCSSRSYNEYYSDLGMNHHHHAHQHSEPPVRIITPRQYRERPISPPSPPRRYTHVYNETDYGTNSQRKKTRDTSVGADLEDVPNVRDNRLEQLPVVHRTIIVEPYPAQPTSQVIVKSEANTNRNTHLEKNSNPTDGGKTNATTTTMVTPKKSKKRNQTNDDIEDVKLDDGYNEHERGNSQTKSKKKSRRLTPKKNVKNAFYE